MTTLEKIKSVQAQMPDEPPAEVRRIVKEVNRLNKWDEALNQMHRQYLADTGEKMDLMEFKMWTLNNCPRFPAQWLRDKAKNN